MNYSPDVAVGVRQLLSNFVMLRVLFGVLCLFPSSQCFEGMKAYKDEDGNVRLFRPDLNIKRLNKSLARLHFPMVDEAAVIELLRYGAGVAGGGARGGNTHIIIPLYTCCCYADYILQLYILTSKIKSLTRGVLA